MQLHVSLVTQLPHGILQTISANQHVILSNIVPHV